MTVAQETATTGTTAPGTSGTSNGLAIAGFVCSLVGALIFWIILAPLGIILGGVGLAKANKGARHRGLALAAVIIGVLDIVVYVILIFALAKNGGSFSYHIG